MSALIAIFIIISLLVVPYLIMRYLLSILFGSSSAIIKYLNGSGASSTVIVKVCSKHLKKLPCEECTDDRKN
jgi:hypothetical protein